jgi:hypothetical protein
VARGRCGTRAMRHAGDAARGRCATPTGMRAKATPTLAR